MSGEHLGEGLSAYLDGELAPAARGEARDHLEGCAACRDEFDGVALARSQVRQLPLRSAPPALAAELVGVSSLRRRPAGRWAMAAAVAAAVGALFLPAEENVRPEIPVLVDSHAARASVTLDPLTQLAPIAVPAGYERE